jgi:hypothetical protein
MLVVKTNDSTNWFRTCKWLNLVLQHVHRRTKYDSSGFDDFACTNL